MKIKYSLAVTALVLLSFSALSADKTKTLSSPDGKIKAEISYGSKVSYSVSYNGVQILNPSEISMSLSDGREYGKNARASVKTGEVNNPGLPTTCYFKSSVDDIYNFLTLNYRGYRIEFRAYNNAVAYRFVDATSKGKFNVNSEQAELNFPEDWPAWITYSNGDPNSIPTQFYCTYESYYIQRKISEWSKGRIAYLPFALEASQGIKVVFMESDLYNYPGLYLLGDGSTKLKGVLPFYPDKESSDNSPLELLPSTWKEYLAHASAGQEFPWRILCIVPEAKDLMNLDLVWQLSRPADPNADWSWLKPGKVAYEWWSNWMLYNVDFRAGINTETYKYHIDFAADNGIEYILLDSGWAEGDQLDLFKVREGLDLKEVVDYANKKGVGVILWALFRALDQRIDEVFSYYSKMGVKGFKIDYIERDDQRSINFYEDVAKAAAKYHLFINFHGAITPAGLQKAYPNVLNFEAAANTEQFKWSNPDMPKQETIVPFIRMAAGSLDFLQGAMDNASKENFRDRNTEPMSQGTRCNQLAEYVVYFSPLEMLCDSPSNYLREKECLQFLAEVPTTWDEAHPIDGKIGEYAVMARRKGDVWYVGALTNWDARELDLDLSFTGGKHITIFKDGINADRVARDYKKISVDLPANGHVNVKMAPGGGWVGIITK